MNNLFCLKGEIAVVIGAGGVIAGAIAEGFAQAGATVAVVDVRPEAGEARAENHQKKWWRCEIFSGKRYG
jgi:NAD(P)-dependent dehydrogenase (short-subunit alcohol dehydrogenase family)